MNEKLQLVPDFTYKSMTLSPDVQCRASTVDATMSGRSINRRDSIFTQATPIPYIVPCKLQLVLVTCICSCS